MIRINLLPFRAARKKENIRRQISVFLLSLIFTSLALYHYHAMLSDQIETLSSQAETVRTKLKTKQKAAREVDRIKKELALLKVAGSGDKRVEALRLADIFRANAVDSTLESFIFSIAGAPEKIDAFADLMRPLGLVEIARTAALPPHWRAQGFFHPNNAIQQV